MNSIAPTTPTLPPSEVNQVSESERHPIPQVFEQSMDAQQLTEFFNGLLSRRYLEEAVEPELRGRCSVRQLIEFFDDGCSSRRKIEKPAEPDIPESCSGRSFGVPVASSATSSVDPEELAGAEDQPHLRTFSTHLGGTPREPLSRCHYQEFTACLLGALANRCHFEKPAYMSLEARPRARWASRRGPAATTAATAVNKHTAANKGLGEAQPRKERAAAAAAAAATAEAAATNYALSATVMPLIHNLLAQLVYQERGSSRRGNNWTNAPSITVPFYIDTTSKHLHSLTFYLEWLHPLPATNLIKALSFFHADIGKARQNGTMIEP